MAPTPRAIMLIGLGAPLAVLLALFNPALWLVGPLWIALCLAAVVFDVAIAPTISRARLSLTLPQVAGVGELFTVDADVGIAGRGAPRAAKIALSVDHRLSNVGRLDAPLLAREGGVGANIALNALRRGIAAVTRAWIGWEGPLGLVRLQHSVAIDAQISVVPSIRAVREEGATLFARDAQIGQRLNARLGEGSEFESLVRFMPGFDRRAIDWKQSARHSDIYAKQFETERDNRIILAIDSGRMMSDPLVDADGTSEPRLDRAVSAALTLGYVALKMEDRVSLVSFAARPKVSPREYNRIGDFAALRRAAAGIDYSLDETNYTLGLASIAAQLKRRAMLVVFTEFADANSAELMIRAAQRLVSKHLVMFVVMADGELEGIAAHSPANAEEMIGATIAAELLRDRRVVLTRLRRMGALVVEAPVGGVTASLLATYIRVKRQGML
ncbi:MAG: DUF58 domain-containing protein [Pseudomonadota bacterium]